MITLENSKFRLGFDETTGFVTEIINPADVREMNYVLTKSAWGNVEGFAVESVEVLDNKVVVTAKGNTFDSKGLSLKIERTLSESGYSEKYTFKNVSAADYFVSQETFGIQFSFAGIFTRSEPINKQVYKNCVAHVWCGYNSCWICGKKLDGSGQKLFVRMTEGDISDYSIKRDLSRTHIAADYRGDILLNPTFFILGQEEEKTFVFEYSFSNEKLEDILKEQQDFINTYAETYTGFVGEKIKMTAEYSSGIKDAKVLLGEEEIPVDKQDNKIVWYAKGDSVGEQSFHVYINDKHTFIRVNFIEDLDTILKKRAYYIAENQQFLKEGSLLDGAYMVYDGVEKRTFFSESFSDHNASRERIAMGIIVLRQLQKKPDEFLMNSIKKHLEFIEREIFDISDGTTYSSVHRHYSARIYNYPWFATYYKEWYLLTKDTKYLKRAALALLKFYEVSNANGDGQMAEPCDIITLLEKENMTDFAGKIREGLLISADKFVEAGANALASECTYVQENPNNRCVYTAQAYYLTGDKKYLDAATFQKNISEAFYGCQPDFHLNAIAVRHWDRFWFGKRKEYGDLFPHYWSALMGWMYGWYMKASGEDCRHLMEEVLKNNLCVYRTDGFAHNNYLYPYKITNYHSDRSRINEMLPEGSFYGKSYDEWSNDQDWALYIADYFMNRQ